MKQIFLFLEIQILEDKTIHLRIVLLFDANKLDISDEFRRSIEAIHGYEDKVRIVLNKADQV